jgi:hypothetical protein
MQNNLNTFDVIDLLHKIRADIKMAGRYDQVFLAVQVLDKYIDRYNAKLSETLIR